MSEEMMLFVCFVQRNDDRDGGYREIEIITMALCFIQTHGGLLIRATGFLVFVLTTGC